MAIPPGFRGAAKRLDDIDLPKIGAMIGVGEDEIHAVLDVESRGSGFDRQGRPLILFEPHIFYRLLSGERRALAVKSGLAYQKWGEKPYPADSYPRLTEAMKINETAALKSCSWGLGQVLGTNHKAAGFDTVQAMVAAFCEDEEAHLLAMVNFIKFNRLDVHLRAHAWAKFAAGYNGPGYAKNRYDTRLAASFAHWSKIKDTAWSPYRAANETETNDPVSGHVTATPLPPSVAITRPKPKPAPHVAPAPVSPQPAAVKPAQGQGWLAAILSIFRKGK
jgi:hypothetical protein